MIMTELFLKKKKKKFKEINEIYLQW